MDARTKKILTNEAVGIIKSLIRCFPTYGSRGLYDAQDIVRNELSKIASIETIVDEYCSDAICSLNEYVNVRTFGKEYENYESVLKKNVYGIVDSGNAGNTLILNGHVDVDIAGITLQDNEVLRKNVSQDKIFGRGASDMFGGLASFIVCTRYLVNTFGFSKGKIVLMSVCDEEIGGNGTLRGLSFLDKYFSDNTYAIIAEPSENTFCTSSFGFLPFEVIIRVPTSHIGYCGAENGYNKLLLIPEIMKKLEDYLLKTNSFDYGEKIIIWNVGKIEGGNDFAIPISELIIGMTILYHPKLNLCSLKEVLYNILNEHFGDFSLSVSDVSFDGAYFDCDFIDEVFRKSKVHKGNFTSPCDARLFSTYSINTAVFGPGSLAQAHSKNEFINIKSIESYIPKLFNVIKGFLEC